MDDASLDAMIADVRARSKLFDGSHVNRDPPMQFDQIATIEASHKIRLHPQYRRFLQVYGAGDFLYSWVFSVDPNSPWSLWRESEYLAGVGATVLPFSDNGCGDYLAFKLVDGVCSDLIFWADHECGYVLSESEYEDFNTFIARVALTPRRPPAKHSP
jgi:hypothetical protein